MMISMVLTAMWCWQNVQDQTVFVDRIAVKVNDKIITQRELVMLYNQRRKTYLHGFQGAELDAKLKEAWTETVTDAEETLLLYEKSVELGLAYSEDDIRSQLQAVKESNGLSEEEFEEQIRIQTGMEPNELISFQIRDYSAQSVIQSQVIRQIKIDDSEIAKYYSENQAKFMTPETYRIAEIVFLKSEGDTGALREEAQACKRFLEGGGDFAEAAAKFSDSASKEKGGDLGVVQFGDLNTTIESAVRSMKIGAISNILETDFAIFIVKLLELNPKKPKPLKDVKEEIVQQLRSPRMETAIKSYLDDLKSQFLLHTYLKEPPTYLDL